MIVCSNSIFTAKLKESAGSRFKAQVQFKIEVLRP